METACEYCARPARAAGRGKKRTFLRKKALLALVRAAADVLSYKMYENTCSKGVAPQRGGPLCACSTQLTPVGAGTL